MNLRQSRFLAGAVMLLALSLPGCGDDEESYQRGYDDGYAEGVEDGKREICGEVEFISDDVASDAGC